MLQAFYILANKLLPYKKVIYFIEAVIGITILLLLILSSSEDNLLSAKVSLLVLLWLLLLNLIIHFFNSFSPKLKKIKMSVIEKIKFSLLKGFYTFLALIFIFISLAIMFLSLKMLSVIF